MTPKPTESMEQEWEKTIKEMSLEKPYKRPFYVPKTGKVEEMTKVTVCVEHVIFLLRKVHQEAIDETKAEQNRVVNSGRKLFQEGQRVERGITIEEIEKWAKQQKTPGLPSILTTVLGHWCIKIDDLLSYLQSLKK